MPWTFSCDAYSACQDFWQITCLAGLVRFGVDFTSARLQLRPGCQIAFSRLRPIGSKVAGSLAFWFPEHALIKGFRILEGSERFVSQLSVESGNAYGFMSLNPHIGCLSPFSRCSS